MLSYSNAIGKKKLCDKLTLRITCDTLHFKATIEMNKQVCAFWELKECRKYYFRMAVIRPALRAVTKSKTVSITFNETNTLRIRHAYHANKKNAYVEFFILPHDNDLC